MDSLWPLPSADFGGGTRGANGMMMASGGNEMAFDSGKLTPNFGPGIDPVPRVPPWTCMVFGDPHVTSFDSKRAVYYTSGEFWILGVSRSNFRASAPTRMTKDLSVTREIAISGLFIDDGRLIIAWRVSPRAGCCASRFFCKYWCPLEKQIL